MKTGTGEAMAQELSLGNGKFTLAQANRKTMDSAQLQDISEMLNMRSKVRTEDQDIRILLI